MYNSFIHLRTEGTRIVGAWGFARADPTAGAYSIPPDPLAGFREREKMERKNQGGNSWKEEGRMRKERRGKKWKVEGEKYA